MNLDDFKVLAPKPREHGEQVFDLFAKTFSQPGYFSRLRQAREQYIGGSHYDWNASRIGMIGDQVVTHFGVWDYQMRIGSARVRCGGIGAVATREDFRKRGLMDATTRAAIAAMRALGYDMSVLFGISDFYHRYGYTRAWSQETYTVNLSALPDEKPERPIAKFVPRHRPDLAALYNREHRGVTGSAVRPTYRQVFHHGPATGYSWTDNRGRLAGYVIVRRQEAGFEIVETTGDVEQCLRVIASLARKAMRGEVRFVTLPHNAPLARRLRLGNCRIETRHTRNAGPLAATINLPATLGKMTGELSRRLRRSPMAKWKGDLLIRDAREKAVLEIRNGAVKVSLPRAAKHAIQGGDEIAQLLIGTDEPLEIVDSYSIKLKGDARALIGVLFPNQRPMMRLCDQF